MDLAVGSGERSTDVNGIIDVGPRKSEHLLTAKAEPERQMHGGIPRVGTRHDREDLRPERGVDHLERGSVAGRSVHEGGVGRVPAHEAASLGPGEGLSEDAEDLGPDLQAVRVATVVRRTQLS